MRLFRIKYYFVRKRMWWLFWGGGGGGGVREGIDLTLSTGGLFLWGRGYTLLYKVCGDMHRCVHVHTQLLHLFSLVSST